MTPLTDEHWMRRCLALASRAQTAGDASVGAVIICGDAAVAEAGEAVRNTLDVADHAEVLAVRAACRVRGSLDLSDCTLYTNVEPCWMCAFALRETGIHRVVYGLTVTDIGSVTSPHPLLTLPMPGWPPPPQITAGVLADECAVLRVGQ